MSSSFQTSTGKLMLLVVLTAVEMVLFQDAWFIVVFPPVTAMTFALNLGMWFLLLRPRWMETRIIGMLLGSFVAVGGNLLYLWLGFTEVRIARRVQSTGPIGALLAFTATDWSTSLSDQGGALATLLRFVSEGATLIEYAVLDLCSLAVIWAAGSLENHLRARRQASGVLGPAFAPPIDDRAVSPL
jgi:hypothetical protein